MSMSVRCAGCGLEYAGHRGLRGLLPGLPPGRRPVRRMLAEVPAFHRRARRLLDAGRGQDEPTLTLGQFLAAGRLLALLPHATSRCRWWPRSGRARRTTALQLPGPLPVRVPATTTACCRSPDRPRGGPSPAAPAATCERIAKQLTGRRRPARRSGPCTGAPAGSTVRDGSRRAPGASTRSSSPPTRTRRCACWPTPPRRSERCSARSGTPPTPAVLHTDAALLPARPGVRASWNYRCVSCCGTARSSVHGQLLHEPAAAAVGRAATTSSRSTPRPRSAGRPGARPDGLLPPGLHPGSVAAQRRLPELNTRVTAYRGRLPRLGVPRGRLPVRRRAAAARWGDLVTAAGCTTCRITHVRDRAGAGARSATAATSGWSTSTSCRRSRPRAAAAGPVPRPRPPRRPGAGASGRTWTHFLSGHGIDLRGGQVLMLGPRPGARLRVQPADRLLVPPTPDGTLRCVVAEVHNTYGERHAYLLRTDDRGRAEAAKEFYVSPFYPVDGGYRMSLPEPGPRLRADRHAAPAGRNRRSWPACSGHAPRPPTGAACCGRPPATLVHPGRVRPHPHGRASGSYLRGLPIVPRPAHPGCPVARGPSTAAAHRTRRQHRQHPGCP